jgi:DHA1 family multidrug resistance protein-like MFS transporter
LKEKPPIKISIFYGWIIVLVAGLAVYFSGPGQRARSAGSMARFIFSAPAGRLSDTVSRKKVIMGGLFAYAIVSLLYVFAWGFNSLLMFRFLHGMGSAATMPVALRARVS